MSTCPTCRQDTRCDSMHGHLRCHREAGHMGVHQADMGRSPAVLRWGVVAFGCADPDCKREPGHELPHRDGNGKSWIPVDSKGVPLTPVRPPADHPDGSGAGGASEGEGGK